MALSKLQKVGVKQMTRSMVDKLGDSPQEKEVKEYWYELNKEKVAAEDAPNKTDLTRLAEFAKTPRDTGSDFVRQMFGKPPMFGKDKWNSKAANTPLVYGAVVQAHNALFKPGNYFNLGTVVVISTDPKHMHDAKYLSGVAEKISAMKNADSATSQDMVKLLQSLRNETSEFCWKVGAGVAGDDATWCGTYKIYDQKNLPTSRIPDDRIIPLVLNDQPRDNIALKLTLVPKQYYS